MERANISEKIVHTAHSTAGAVIAGFIRVLDRVQGVEAKVAIMEDPGANLHVSEEDKAALNATRTSAEPYRPQSD